VLAELSYFFHQLCAKELSRTMIADMEIFAPMLLLKLEKIFPPALFNPMQHLILHLPYEAQMGGHAVPLVVWNREMSEGFSKNVKINAKLKLPLHWQTF
jgi:hypothetical protein